MLLSSRFTDVLIKKILMNQYRINIPKDAGIISFNMKHFYTFTNLVLLIPFMYNFLVIGSDLARSLLVFAQGKKLGPHGLDWLKIHLINLTGFKKRFVKHKFLLTSVCNEQFLISKCLPLMLFRVKINKPAFTDHLTQKDWPLRTS